jgi:hypothetical protein
MLACGPWADSHLAAGNVRSITLLFLILVLLAATQDIAVDGWALTLLSRRHVGYAATCQVMSSPSDCIATCVDGVWCGMLRFARCSGAQSLILHFAFKGCGHEELAQASRISIP